jgi:hypothetical protein
VPGIGPAIVPALRKRFPEQHLASFLHIPITPLPLHPLTMEGESGKTCAVFLLLSRLPLEDDGKVGQ